MQPHDKTVQDQHEKQEKQLKVSSWPQNTPDPNLTEFRPVHLWMPSGSAVGMKGFNLSETIPGWALRVKEHLYQYQDPGFFLFFSSSSVSRFNVVVVWCKVHYTSSSSLLQEM